MVASNAHASSEKIEKADGSRGDIGLGKAEGVDQLVAEKDEKTKSGVPFELYKKRTTAFVRREKFLDMICDALTEYKYVGPNQRADLVLACRYGTTILFVIKWHIRWDNCTVIPNKRLILIEVLKSC